MINSFIQQTKHSYSYTLAISCNFKTHQVTVKDLFINYNKYSHMDDIVVFNQYMIGALGA